MISSIVGGLMIIGGLIFALVLAVGRSKVIKRERDDALDHIATERRVEEAARNAPDDHDRARDELRDRVDRMRRSQRH